MKNPSLNTVQRWLQSVITHPAGVDAGLASSATQSQLNLAIGEIEQIIQPSHCQSSAARLAIYANAYYARLIECLQADFPIFRQTVGDDAFAEFATDYLQHYPSHSYTLCQLGENFVRYLNDTKPAASEADSDFSDFLIDLALLERTISEVFDGPGCEESPRLHPENLLVVDPDAWSRAKVEIAPCLRLLTLCYPLNDYYTAVKSGGQAPPPERKNSWLAITRRDYIVRRYPLSHAQFTLLDNLQHDKSIGEAITAAAAVYPGNLDVLAADIQNWFRIWTAAPMFEKVTTCSGQ